MSRLGQVHRHRRGDTYYFRVAIPTRLQDRLGSREYKKSLQTSDYKVASRICRVMSTVAEDFFMAVDAMPTEADYKQLMRQYFERQLRNAFTEHAQISGMYYGGEDPSAPEDLYGFIEGARRYHLRMKELSLTESSLPEQDAEAVQLLENSGFGSSYVATANLTRRLVDADLEASRIARYYGAEGGRILRNGEFYRLRWAVELLQSLA